MVQQQQQHHTNDQDMVQQDHSQQPKGSPTGLGSKMKPRKNHDLANQDNLKCQKFDHDFNTISCNKNLLFVTCSVVLNHSLICHNMTNKRQHWEKITGQNKAEFSHQGPRFTVRDLVLTEII